jgi:hypothetical protein
MRLFDGEKFALVENCITNTDPPIHGGVEVSNNMINFNSGGYVYSYGSDIAGQKDALFNRTRSSGSTSGMLKNFVSNTLYISAGATSGAFGGLQTLSGNYSGSALWCSMGVEPFFNFDEYGEIEYVQTKFAGTASGGASLALQLKTEKNATTTTIFTGVTTITAQTTAESATSKRLISSTNKDSSDAQLPNFSSLSLRLIWGGDPSATDAPRISEVNVFYKNRKLIG